MSQSRIASGALGRKPAFSLWGWAMLFVILLCSAPTGGPPRTRTVGSAFDPATTAVVVKPSQTRLGQKAAKVKPGDLPADAVVAHDLTAEFASAALSIGQELPDSEFRYSDRYGEIAALRRLTRPLGTRAPPAA